MYKKILLSSIILIFIFISGFDKRIKIHIKYFVNVIDRFGLIVQRGFSESWRKESCISFEVCVLGCHRAYPFNGHHIFTFLQLYVSYAHGLFTSVGTVGFNYQFTKRVSVEAKSGENQAVDLIYTIERN